MAIFSYITINSPVSHNSEHMNTFLGMAKSANGAVNETSLKKIVRKIKSMRKSEIKQEKFLIKTRETQREAFPKDRDW